ncbi:MAG: hypothetical protein FJW56_00295 [Actinobacteria bacterium]|nr:hypothetical protein [Actinomycetota bacterium]
MKTEQPILITSIPFTATIDPNYEIPQHSVVNKDGAVTSEGNIGIGVATNTYTFPSGLASDNPVISAIAKGIALCISSEAITKGALVRPTDNGKVTDSDVFPDNFPFGIALDGCASADELIRILLI